MGDMTGNIPHEYEDFVVEMMRIQGIYFDKLGVVQDENAYKNFTENKL
uniref:Uncharacterized protein n=1 Tax=Romanomermis culicivorax TaxID=13658 RepID=A0A915IA91_ROMCU